MVVQFPECSSISKEERDFFFAALCEQLSLQETSQEAPLVFLCKMLGALRNQNQPHQVELFAHHGHCLCLHSSDAHLWMHWIHYTQQSHFAYFGGLAQYCIMEPDEKFVFHSVLPYL